VVTDMISNPFAQAGTALSPEWDRGFDEAFTELITGDPELVRDEFDALIGANFTEPPPPPAPPAPAGADPAGPAPGPALGPVTRAGDDGQQPGASGNTPRPPP
jgi:hypothetical protein